MISNTFLATFSFSPPSETTMIWQLDPLLLSHSFMKFSKFPLSIFSSCCSSWVNSIDLFSSSLIVSCYVYSISKYPSSSVSQIGSLSSDISIWLFLTNSVSWLWFSFTFFKAIYNCWRIFRTGALKSLPDNSDTWLISVLSSANCLFKFVVFYLFLDIMSDFLLYCECSV